MSVPTLKRTFFAVVTLLLGSTAVFAGHPSVRSYPRMAFDAKAGNAVLFGGESAFDGGTQLQYDSDETWIWGGNHWTQVFPANNPGGRTAHGMVYDSTRQRIVLFGGRRAKTTPDGDITILNDTWVWENGDWREIIAPNGAPSPRHLFGMTYDPIRDRVIVYGGSIRIPETGLFIAANDTWEFDGTQWNQVATEPKVAIPLMTYDAKRNQTIMVGVIENLATVMYAYDAAAEEWKKVEPEKLPTCVNDATMTYRAANGTVVVNGGVCSIETSPLEQTWEWDGTNWTEVKTVPFSRSVGQAIAYDSLRDAIVTFGGFLAFQTTPNSFTSLFRNDNWRLAFATVRPVPRSLFAFATDTVTRTIWMFGGLNEFGSSYMAELWGYRNGQWFSLALSGAPVDCSAPMAAFDANRGKLVLNCGGLTTFEFDGSKWNLLAPRNNPPSRRFAAMVYDETLKRVVLFGGYDGLNYRNDTWTFDGTDWTEVKKNKPQNRGMMAMWYDPLQQKTILYGGLGRGNINERITRYTDMWAFNGTGWTKLNVTATPGERFGAQAGVDRRTGKLYLFGGLRAEIIEDDRRRQFFDDETWEWNGQTNTWTRLTPARAPHARQNGGFAWDPVANRLVLFAGYAGFYYSDTWLFDGANWTPRVDGSARRRSSGPGGGSLAPPTSPALFPRGD
ncbi:MAG TPA: kelch repeat-containing protein [Thermoanaerobaculia bacterium]|nr:kelch repeat-containing protein [Thermoanaerobaculia bacterium]